MKIQMVGGSYQERSLPLDCQRCINLFPIVDQQGGKEPSALYGTPGLDFYGQAGNGLGRGIFFSSGGRLFIVSGNEFWEMAEGGSSSFWGNLSSSVGPVTIDENGLQLAVCDGTKLYIFTYATNAFVTVTDPDLPSALSVTFINGYFVCNQVNAGTFYISALYDGTSWGALDFATAESSPDNLVRVINAVGQLWLQGTKTTEIWTNTGAASFPFARIAGAKMEVGIVCLDTAVAVDNSLFWVSQSNIGACVVYRANGFTPQRISTSPIEILLQQYLQPPVYPEVIKPQLRAYTYEEDGHTFYIINGGDMSTSLVYDVSTQLWHERARLNSDGIFEQHLAVYGVFAFKQHLALSRLNGFVYIQSLSLYDDYGDQLVSERIFPHTSKENERIRYKQLEIAAEMGVGLNTNFIGKDPQILLSISKDQGQTWSSTYAKQLGKVGKYKNRCAWRRLGIATDIVFKVRITDPVKRSLIGAYLT